ncbi:MAG TPA: serine/threonine protein kinase [Planctomycetaceae bacterium]|jgi:serine/threonine protein kinase|nr:serine/threonine protein kinase [Pirellulales bacterium]HAL14368.1 serine/threonine protein kinase [Planctomycetaceae bacterium]|tara:strand:- start:10657 stop:11811 length:1155 start_codon:yes stop_codon:yes gene_type:complete
MSQTEQISKLVIHTTQHGEPPTVTLVKDAPAITCDPKLLDAYNSVLDSQRLNWTSHQCLTRRLGAGGQGVVYLSERRGSDGFTIPLAIKVFSPERFEDEESYSVAMRRNANISARIAQIQHDNLLVVHNFVDRNRIRMLVMEWIDGFDLRHLLNNKRVEKMGESLEEKQRQHVHDVVIRPGPQQAIFKPGMAVAVVRDCLAALKSLHEGNIVHGDIKPANIMIKRSGMAKIIDIGSAYALDDVPEKRTCTPTYAAPEVIEGGEATAKSDLASLGYVLLELLSGKAPFQGLKSYGDLVRAKQELPDRIPELLPPELSEDNRLVKFCHRLVAYAPEERFNTATEANLLEEGALGIHRQLVVSQQDSDYDHELHELINTLMLIDTED